MGSWKVPLGPQDSTEYVVHALWPRFSMAAVSGVQPGIGLQGPFSGVGCRLLGPTCAGSSGLVRAGRLGARLAVSWGSLHPNTP